MRRNPKAVSLFRYYILKMLNGGRSCLFIYASNYAFDLILKSLPLICRRWYSILENPNAVWDVEIPSETLEETYVGLSESVS